MRQISPFYDFTYQGKYLGFADEEMSGIFVTTIAAAEANNFTPFISSVDGALCLSFQTFAGLH